MHPILATSFDWTALAAAVVSAVVGWLGHSYTTPKSK
jgi:hypothetical protein